MANNVGTTTLTLPRIIGETIDYDTSDEWNSITILNGELNLGCIIFDDDGTMGVCSSFTRDDDGNPIYTIRTMTLNTEIDIQELLSESY